MNAPVGSYVRVTAKGRTHIGEVVRNDPTHIILDGPVSVVTIPKSIITKIEVTS